MCALAKLKVHVCLFICLLSLNCCMLKEFQAAYQSASKNCPPLRLCFQAVFLVMHLEMQGYWFNLLGQAKSVSRLTDFQKLKNALWRTAAKIDWMITVFGVQHSGEKKELLSSKANSKLQEAVLDPSNHIHCDNSGAVPLLPPKWFF